MSIQNFSLPYAPAGYFGVDASASPQFFYNEPYNQNAPNIFPNTLASPLPPPSSASNDRRKQPAGPTASSSAGPPLTAFSADSFRLSGTQYTRITSGSEPRSGKTSVHAIVDYDDDFDDEYSHSHDNEYNEIYNTMKQYPLPMVTPIQGPIFLKNGSVPVVPLYSYPKVNNGSFVQIPIMWAALSLALGYEIRGDIIRGPPCIKRHQQLFCPTAGTSYPKEQIERFIDDNKALVRRMYGEFESSIVDYGPRDGYTQQRYKRTRNYQQPPASFVHGESYFNRLLNKRQTTLPKIPKSESGRVDSCESKLEVVTPYWASNSAGKIRAVVNNQHFEQAIHQEICSKSETKRCSRDCRCEQKYKWHRLLAYDPDNDCKGIFMDWFLFPSCCICRCTPN